MSFENQEELMRTCVDYYYNRGMSQSEIAKKTYISRSSVCRLLKLARDKNIVQITVNEKRISCCSVLERIFEQEFGLDKAIITFTNSQKETADLVSEAASHYIDNCLKENSIIAISRGNTMKNVVKAINPSRKLPISVVQLIGLMNNPEKNDDEMEIAKTFASKYGGDYYNLYSPFIIEDQKVKEVFLQYAAVGKTLEMAEKADMVITSIGAYSADDKHIISNSYLNEEEKKDLVVKGAIGLICGTYYDGNGTVIETSIDKYIIGLDFKKIIEKNVIGIAYGPTKVLPVLGALRGGFIDVLIIDQLTALNILIENGTTIDY